MHFSVFSDTRIHVIVELTRIYFSNPRWGEAQFLVASMVKMKEFLDRGRGGEKFAYSANVNILPFKHLFLGKKVLIFFNYMYLLDC